MYSKERDERVRKHQAVDHGHMSEIQFLIIEMAEALEERHASIHRMEKIQRLREDMHYSQTQKAIVSPFKRRKKNV